MGERELDIVIEDEAL